MASAIRDIKNKHFTAGFTEIVERGRGSLKSRRPQTNQYVFSTQVGNVGWHRGSGPFTEADEIDTDWQPTTGTWDYEMTQADYQAYIDTAGNYRYDDYLTGEYVNLNVTFFGWTNDEGQSQLIPFDSVVPTVDGDVMTWDGLWGAGTKLRIQTQTARLAKYLDFTSLSNLPPPTIGGTNIKLTMSYTLSRSNGVAIYADGVLWDENSTLTTSTEIEFRQTATGTPVWFFEIPRAWDNAFERVAYIGTQTLKQAGANLFVDAHIPYSWILNASFPITIDPSVTPQVGASSDDAFTDGAANTASLTATDLYIGDGNTVATYRRGVGTRFQVNASGTCDLAYIEVCSQYNTTMDTPIDTLADDADNPSAWVSNLAIENQITSTSAVLTTHSSYSYVVDTFARAGGASQDLKDIVQEIFDRPGWAANQYMRFAFLGQRVQNYLALNTKSYDLSTSLCPRLYVEYTESGGSDTLTASDVTSGTPTVDTSSILEAILLRPTSDITVGNWTPSEGSTLYGVVDEVTPDDNDFMRSEVNPSASLAEVGLGSSADPQTSDFHLVRYRYAKHGSATLQLVFYLMEGTTQIATWSDTDVPGTPTTGEYQLSVAEANSITNYANLRIRVVATEI